MDTKDIQHWKDEAVRYDLVFNGMQKFTDGEEIPLFSHPLYGTFAVQKNETLPHAIVRKRKQFASADAEPGTGEPRMGKEKV
jgi:hypothetical protein